MNLDQFIKQVEANLKILHNDFSFSVHDFSIDNLHEQMKEVDSEEIDMYLGEEMLFFSLPQCEEVFTLNIKEIKQYVDELNSARLIDNVECHTNQRLLVRAVLRDTHNFIS